MSTLFWIMSLNILFFSLRLPLSNSVSDSFMHFVLHNHSCSWYLEVMKGRMLLLELWKVMKWLHSKICEGHGVRSRRDLMDRLVVHPSWFIDEFWIQTARAPIWPSVQYHLPGFKPESSVYRTDVLTTTQQVPHQESNSNVESWFRSLRRDLILVKSAWHIAVTKQKSLHLTLLDSGTVHFYLPDELLSDIWTYQSTQSTFSSPNPSSVATYIYFFWLNQISNIIRSFKIDWIEYQILLG